MNHMPDKKMFPDPKYKVYVSYHHCIEDQECRNHFEEILLANQDVAIMKSTQIENIGPDLSAAAIRQLIKEKYLKDSTVTVVLIGSNTWKQRQVDWEIEASIETTQNNQISGLFGIVTPSYHKNDTFKYNEHTIPPRLNDNIRCGFASIHFWDTDPFIIQNWIHDAFERRTRFDPDNSRPIFVDNLLGSEWHS